MSRWSIATVFLLAGTGLGAFLFGPLALGQNSTPAAIPKELTSYRDVVKSVLPAVVSIQSEARPRPPGRSSRFYEPFQDPADEDEDTPHAAFGSGFLVDPTGVILTNYHVVAGANSVVVQLTDGRKFTSRDLKVDPKTDLAIVRIKAGSHLPYLELGDSSAMEIGDRVLAAGAPFGLTGSVTSGIISAKGRNNLNVNMYEDFLQTDAAMNPGNSGGPLVNLSGQVIGINSAIKSRTGGSQGVGLAVASNLARKVMKSLETDGTVHRGYLGIQMGALSPEVADRLGTAGGVVVGHVFDGSPAARAGIEPGDVITQVGGQALTGSHELQETVAGLPLNKPVAVVVLRDGKRRSFTVTIEEQPGDYGTVAAGRSTDRSDSREGSRDRVGIEAQDLSAELAERLGFRENAKGALITQVGRGSLAAQAGLARGMLITRFDQKRIESADEFREELAKANLAKGVLLQVQSPRIGTRYLVLKE
jgi:serine protease Do